MQLAVALAAEEAAGVQALRTLSERGHRIVCAFTEGKAERTGSNVAGLASTLGVPVRPAGAVREAATGAWLRDQGADLLLNIHSLHIVADALLEAPKLGAFNLHPGPLPEIAGLNAPSWALYEGATSHGVTLHRMTAGVDEGDIAYTERFPIGPKDNALALMTQCVRRGIGLVELLLDAAERGDPIPAIAQDPARRRWFGFGPPENGALDWDRPAARVTDWVRACDYGPFPSPWGFPRCVVGGREVAIAAAAQGDGEAGAAPGEVLLVEDKAALVAAADLPVKVERVEVDGSTVPAGDILREGDLLEPARPLAEAR